MKRTKNDLITLQSLPLEVKVQKTINRVNEFVEHFGVDGVYISCGGGKDSTVLVDIIHNRMNLKEVPIVFVDVPTQYKELKTFTEENMENVIILRPKISFVEVCRKYGFPLISKEISSVVNGAKKHYSKITDKYKYHYNRVLGKEEYAKDGKRHMYACTKYKPLLDAPFDISSKCCDVMKKKPIKEYEKKSGRHGFLGTQATESRYREQSWLRNGCNAFNDVKRPISQPLMFWTEQDILKYIYDNKLKICSVYGEVKVDEDGKYYTTGCDRTGCLVCGFGCHLEKEPNRYQKLVESHPSYLKLLDICKNNDVTMREAIEWCNEHINRFHIELPSIDKE